MKQCPPQRSLGADQLHTSSGFAAVPLVHREKTTRRQFTLQAQPLYAAGLAMPRVFLYQDRTNSLVLHQREKCGCPCSTHQRQALPTMGQPNSLRPVAYGMELCQPMCRFDYSPLVPLSVGGTELRHWAFVIRSSAEELNFMHYKG